MKTKFYKNGIDYKGKLEFLEAKELALELGIYGIAFGPSSTEYTIGYPIKEIMKSGGYEFIVYEGASLNGGSQRVVEFQKL